MNTLTKEQAKELILKVQKGTASFQDEKLLLIEIESRYSPHKIDNYIYDAEEMKSEFILASWGAVYRAKPNIGDPISFCINRGRGAMLDYYRKVGSQKLMLVCTKCGFTMTYDRRNIQCKVCKCEDLTSVEKETIKDVNDFDTDFYTEDSIQENINYNEMFNEILQLIDLLEDLDFTTKKLAKQSILERQSFYDYARQIGKSHSWSITFNKKVQKAMEIFKDRFLLV